MASGDCPTSKIMMMCIYAAEQELKETMNFTPKAILFSVKDYQQRLNVIQTLFISQLVLIP